MLYHGRTVCTASEESVMKEQSQGGGISRRSFLKGVGGGLVATGTIADELLGQEASAQVDGAHVFKGKQIMALSVNGQRRSVEVEPRTTLLSALRGPLDLTGAKEVCDRGQCGACTVLVDGAPMLACMLLAIDVRNRAITTVEGLDEDGALSAVQEAFVELDGLMCGFCTPGLVMAATALLGKNPNPTSQDIRRGLSGNLCRCGTYPNVFAAVQKAAETMRG